MKWGRGHAKIAAGVQEIKKKRRGGEKKRKRARL